ncbi:DUF305 domain-containing protein [Nonomuraea sp. NPDC049750]|uniref:DUF305 domain-containing protein n=1 Tax=Nonomuraea sp. NPDC049750 TaxID=3154738 RepID=UPI00340580F9
MKRSILVGITAGSLLAATAATGIAMATADDAIGRQAAGQSTVCQTGWGMMGPGGPMHGVRVSDEAAYLTQMVAHHQEAVAAAKQLQRSGRAQMRALGASIVATQNAEIATMNTWLATWYPGRATGTRYQPMMRDLSKLSGDALDETFLCDMIPHHMTAIMMSQYLLASGHAQHPRVATLAAKIRDTQHAEMFQMQRYLADWFGGSTMPGHMWGRPGGSSPTSWPGKGGMMGW